MAPELKGRILNQLDEGDEESPGVWPVYNQSLQQYPVYQTHTCPKMLTEPLMSLFQLR